MERKPLAELIELVQAGNEAAFNELYGRYYKLVRYIAYGLTKSNADTDEIIQEVFLQVQKSLGDLKNANQFKAWLSRITYSKAKMLFRKNRDRYMSDEFLDLLQNEEEGRIDYLPHQYNRHQSDMDVLYQCMQRLKPAYREVLILYYFSQMNIKEIMDLTELPEGTVKSRLLYAKKYLRMEIEAYEEQTGERLSFRAHALEGTLLGLGATLVKEPKVTFPLFHKFKRLPLSIQTISLVLASAIGVGAAIRTYDYFYRKPDSSLTMMTQDFPTIYYYNQRITTPRQAYSVLLEWADCDVEMRNKSTAEIQAIEPVYTALMEFGEGYAELLQRRNWDQYYEKYR